MPLQTPVAEPPIISFVRPAPPPRAELPALGLRVLVADDNHDAADTLAGLLFLCGADVRTCYDGVAAADAAGWFRPDVGVFDVHMPGIDGCDLARRVRGAAGGRPVLLVAVTGVSDPDAVLRTADAGFDLHLTKPADPAGLVRTLAEFEWRLRQV